MGLAALAGQGRRGTVARFPTLTALDVDPDPGIVGRVKLHVVAEDGGTKKRAEPITNERLGAVNDGWEGNAARGTNGLVNDT